MSKRDLAPGFGRFEFRPGIKNFPGFRGMTRQLDPGAIPPNQFYHLQNVRILDGEVVSRGGSSAVNLAAETGCITGVFDNLEPLADGQAGLFISTNSPVDVVTRVGAWTGTAYSDLYAGDINGGSGISVLTPYLGNPVIVAGLKAFSIDSGGTATELFTLGSAPQDAIEFDGSLFLICNLNTELVKWDGASLTTIATGGYIGRVWASDTDLYIGGSDDLVTGTNPYIASMSNGFVPFTWAGPTAAKPTSRMVNLFGKLWTGWVEIGGSGKNAIISINGSTLTYERQPSDHGVNSHRGVHGLANLGGVLVYAHNQIDKATIGTYDGVTWTDEVMDLTNTQPEIATVFIDDMTSFNSELYVFEDGNSAVPPRDAGVVRCATVGGTWTADVVPANKFNSNQDVPWTPLITI